MYKKIFLIFASVICLLALSMPEARALNLNGWGSSVCSKLFSPPGECPQCLTVFSYGTGAGNTCVNPLLITARMRLIRAYAFCQNQGGNWKGKKPTVEPVSVNFDAQQIDVTAGDAIGPDELDFRGQFLSNVLFPETLLYDIYGSGLSNELCEKKTWSLVENSILPSYFYTYIEATSCETLTFTYAEQDTGQVLRYTATPTDPGEGDYTRYGNETDGYYYVWNCGAGDWDIAYDPEGALELSDYECTNPTTVATAEGDCEWTAGGLPIQGDYSCEDSDIQAECADGTPCDWPFGCEACPPAPSP